VLLQVLEKSADPEIRQAAGNYRSSLKLKIWPTALLLHCWRYCSFMLSVVTQSMGEDSQNSM
jgi:hypothetical protein